MATQADGKWKVKREISLGDLVAIAVAMGGVILAYGTLDKRISVLEAGVEKSTTSVINEAKSDDVTVAGGDLLQLYYKNSPGSGNGTFVSSVVVQATVGEITTVLQD